MATLCFCFLEKGRCRKGHTGERCREGTKIFHLLGQSKKKKIVIFMKYIAFTVMETRVLEKHSNGRGKISVTHRAVLE